MRMLSFCDKLMESISDAWSEIKEKVGSYVYADEKPFVADSLKERRNSLSMVTNLMSHVCTFFCTSLSNFEKV
jgi:hypothetical protein